jgi:hypothetical protein
VTQAPAGEDAPPEQPPPHEKWHPIAKQWYESLARSGQSAFYEASDWATAFLVAESISRDLKPQPIGVDPETGEPVMAVIPLKGASLAAYLRAMTALMVTEGDRRRAGLELRRASAGQEQQEVPGVARLDEFRRRFAG